jgi:hypothetical protein
MANGRSPQEVFQHHAQVLGAQNLDGIVSDYTEDATFITQLLVRGRCRTQI